MKLRQFQDIDLNFAIDIGANIGIVTSYVKTLFPTAKVIAMEPEVQTFECLKKNTYFMPDVHLENKAFGNGESCSIVKRGNRFIDRYTVEDKDGDTLSMTLKQVFNKYNLDMNSKYFIKSDCEGAEVYFILDDFCREAIGNAEIFFMEAHFKSKNTPMFKIEWKVYDEWLRDNFSITHKIEYYKSSKHGGYGHYLLTKKG